MKREEIWRPVVGYEELYEVSYDGDVYSLYKGKDLKPGLNKNGYMYVMLYKDGKRKNCSIHRLIAQAFIPNPENKKEVDHINRNRTDNRVENLRWVCRSDNVINTGIRKDNKLGIKNITKIGQDFLVSIKRNKHRYRKLCKTEEEAIAQKALMLSMWI
jgi:hypothetical protein